MIKIQTNLDENQVEKLQAEIDMFANEQTDVFFNDLINVFATTDFDEDYVMKNTYLRWFTEISVKKFLSLPVNFLEEVFFVKQISVSFLLGYDVLDKLLFYTASNYYLKSSEEILRDFDSFKETVKKSGAIIGKIGEQKIAFSDIVAKFVQLQDAGEFKKYLGVLFDDIKKQEEYFDEYFTDSRELFVENISKFVEFLFSSEKKDIFKIADEYVRTGELKTFKKDISKREDINDNKIMQIPAYSQIKSKIIQFFPKNEQGEIIDNEGVFEVLEKTATKYGDDKIKELYYYNESTGKFEWGI